MKENSYDNNMSELDEEKVNYQELLFIYNSLALVCSFRFGLFSWSLGIFTFSDSCLSGFRFYHDKE